MARCSKRDICLNISQQHTNKVRYTYLTRLRLRSSYIILFDVKLSCLSKPVMIVPYPLRTSES